MRPSGSGTVSGTAGGRLGGRANLDIDFPAGTSSDREDKFRPVRCELAGRFRKGDRRRANHTVETLVAEPYRIRVHGGLESPTAVPAGRSRTSNISRKSAVKSKARGTIASISAKLARTTRS